MRVVVAPAGFGGRLTARQAARAIGAGLRRARPDVQVAALPLGDGGPGTLDALAAAGFARVPVAATGPTGAPVAAAIGLRGDTAAVELAAASGRRRLPGGRPAPLAATTYGTGELVRAALDRGARALLLGAGGGAATDGGAGMAAALGARLLDARGAPLGPGGAALLRLDRVELDGLDPRLARLEVTVAADDDGPLVGPNGAAAGAAARGARPDEVLLLDSALRRYARVLADRLGADLAGAPGTAAGGGLGAGAIAFLGATVRPGVEPVLDLVGFERSLDGADLVVTATARLDADGLHGGAVPVGVARAAGAQGVPVVVLAGAVEVAERELRAAGFEEAYALAARLPDREEADALLAPAGPGDGEPDAAGLERLAERVGRVWASLP